MAVFVNGVEISDHAIHAELQYHPAGSVEEAREAAARALVVRELLLQAAGRLGIERPDPLEGAAGARETDDEALIRALITREVATPEPDDATCRRFYDNNLQRFRSADLFEAAHILFPADPEDADACAGAKQRAAAALAQALEQPRRFAELAQQLSACPSAAQGGNLGQITRGQTVPELETFLFNLEPGQICPVPVKTRYGYHVVRLDRRIEGRQLPFDAVRDKIADYLREHVWRRAVSQYLQLLVGQAEIRGIELDGARTPLVQ
ncbi:MAG TPA: peptidylprolyl isomerase [Geminicoccaceae bacterium]|nr:peptidylprolyl isomerase [Geminicoccaceae bacterium]